MKYKIEKFPKHNNIIKDIVFDYKSDPVETILNAWAFCSCMIGTYMICYWVSYYINITVMEFIYHV